MITHVLFEEGSGSSFRRTFFLGAQIHFFPWRIDKGESLKSATLQREGNDFTLVAIMATTKRTCMIKRAEVLHQEMVHISCNFLVHIPTFRSTQTTSLSREKNTIYLARPKYRHVVKRRMITWSTILLPYYMLHGFSSTPNSILVQVNWATVDNPIVPGVRSSETAMSV